MFANSSIDDSDQKYYSIALRRNGKIYQIGWVNCTKLAPVAALNWYKERNPILPYFVTLADFLPPCAIKSSAIVDNVAILFDTTFDIILDIDK